MTRSRAWPRSRSNPAEPQSSIEISRNSKGATWTVNVYVHHPAIASEHAAFATVGDAQTPPPSVVVHWIRPDVALRAYTLPSSEQT